MLIEMAINYKLVAVEFIFFFWSKTIDDVHYDDEIFCCWS